jgi:non-heme chloroperoxidase
MTRRTILLIIPVALAGVTFSGPSSAQPDFRSDRFTTSDGVELHYLEASSGPVLVFVPGFTAPAEIWDPQLRHFAADHRVIALDPRSQGRSEKVTEDHYLARRGRDIAELIAHLSAAPVVVVGWSSGVLELLTHVQESGPAALRAVVLVDMYIGVDTEPGQLHPIASLWTTWIKELQLNRRS